MTVIAHNISALNTTRQLQWNNRNLSSSLQKLSSGYRINTGADGPADLIISEQLRAQNAGLERAVKNTQEAMNVIGIAEGALNEMNAILKSMRALALHSANNGITSPIQVAADQSEVDSSIQTLDRIANTTKYSDQFLLNGGKSIVFDRTTFVFGTQQNSLLDLGLTRINQIFKRKGYSVSLAFTGTANVTQSAANVGTADLTKAATKAYFEIDGSGSGDVNSSNNTLTQAQVFTITGNKGSKQFSFDKGATLGQIAAAINNVADSTGVDATLIFSSTQISRANTAASVTAATVGGAATRSTGDIVVFNNNTSAGISAVTSGVTGVVVGKNTDGNGRIWVKYTSNTSYELYKDSSYAKEALVGYGVSGSAIVAANNSGLGGLSMTLTGSPLGTSGTYLAVDGLNNFATTATTSGDTTAGVLFSGALFSTTSGANTVNVTQALISGVQLGKNTDSEGKLYVKAVVGSAVNDVQFFVYKDAQMRNEDLVAQSASGRDMTGPITVVVNEVRSTDNTTGTGLGLAFSNGAAWTATNTTITGTITFTKLGVRISSQEYGADQFIRIQQDTGKIWQYYDQIDSSTPTLVDAGTSGITVQRNGQNATLTVNGTAVQTRGLELDLSTQDMAGHLVFNEGKVGSTTIAQVGYTEGTWYSRAKLLTQTGVSNYSTLNNGTVAWANGVGGLLCNPGHVTTEALAGFRNGMQFQLGEGQGDQERTVYSIQSMAVSNLGLTKFYDRFDSAKPAVYMSKTLSLQSVLGGGLASLAVDPVKALKIIDQAIEDVSGLRARLGATQKNLLQTNANSLQVAIENIQKTESAIRDADMAAETTEFTRNQIMVSAATAMLAQANAAQQQVLQLLG